MSPRARIVIFSGIVVALCIGTYWLGHERGLADAFASKAATVEKPQEVSRLQAEIPQLKNERTALDSDNRPEDGTAANARANAAAMDRLHTFVEFQQEHLATISLPIINGNSKLAAGFTDLFNLTPSETATLQQAIDQARQQTDQIMATNAGVSRNADGSVLISVPPVAAGSSIRDGLMDAFAQILGPDRNKAFLALQSTDRRDSLDNMFSEFGTQQRTITLTRQTSPRGTVSGYTLQDEVRIPDGENSTLAIGFVDASTINPRFRWVIPLVPQDF